MERIKSLHDRLGGIMHERNSYADWPGQAEALAALTLDFNTLRSEHQWLWNRFWQHSTRVHDKLFFINFGDMANSTQPTIVKMEGLLNRELNIQFDPDYLADFTGEVEWRDYVDVA